MPSVTRSQTKNLKVAAETPVKKIASVSSFNCGTLNCRTGQYTIYKHTPKSSIQETRANLVAAKEFDEFKETLLQMMNKVHEADPDMHLYKITQIDNVVKYCLLNIIHVLKYERFTISVYDKMCEFEQSVNQFKDITLKIYATESGFLSDCALLKKTLNLELIKMPLDKLKDASINSQINFNHFKRDILEPLMNAKNGLRRSPRKYKKVDYTGMDTIEPESKYDGITDIWKDETIYEDPDYKPCNRRL